MSNIRNHTNIPLLEHILTDKEMQMANMCQLVWDAVLAPDPAQPPKDRHYNEYYHDGLAFLPHSHFIHILHSVYDCVYARQLITAYGYSSKRRTGVL